MTSIPNRNPVASETRLAYRFIATHPDGSIKHGDWKPSETVAQAEGREYAKSWLMSVKRLGLEGQKVRVDTQTRTHEVRLFLSRPTMSAEYGQLNADHWGNVWGIS
jgi:hypothetical protein